MIEKYLTESEWKKFRKGRDDKDAAFMKSLAALASANAPQAELVALGDIAKQADILRKAAKSDKELGVYLDLLEKSVDRQRKAAEVEMKKSDRSPKSEEDDEEDISPALLTSKMIPLLRQVKKGEQLHVLLAVAGKTAVVMLARRAISPSRRKLLADYLDGGTAKFYAGHCTFEEKAFTFVMKTQAAGLAKKVKAALLKQVELRLKVRVRGEDPDDIDDDGDTDEDEPLGEAESSKSIGAAKPDVVETPAFVDPLKVTFERRLAAIEPKVTAALKEPGSDASKIRAVAQFVREKGEAEQYKAALAGMDSLQKLIAASDLTASGATSSTDAVSGAFNARLAALVPRVKDTIATNAPGATQVKSKIGEAGVLARKKDFANANGLLDEVEALLASIDEADDATGDRAVGSVVRLQQSRVAWDGLRKSLQDQLRGLESALLAKVREYNAEADGEDEFDEADLDLGVRGLKTSLGRLDARLIDKLDEALNAEGVVRDGLRAQAMSLVKEYQAFVESDPTIAAIDANGFVTTTIRASARNTLADLAAQL